MEKAVLISIKPKWCTEITSGRKTLEIRKSAPKDLYGRPFRCFIYCTKEAGRFFISDSQGKPVESGGRVIGEFVCDDIQRIGPEECVVKEDIESAIAGSCLTVQQVKDYARWKYGMRYVDLKDLYGWHISDLKIYDVPRELQSFTGLQKTRFGLREVEITRAPQSWCYVMEGGNHK